MKLLLALIPIALVAQPSGSNTQLQIVGNCSTPATATLEVGTDAGLSSLVNDVNTTLFAGSNAANRAGNVIIGNSTFFNVGTRVAQTVTGTFNSVTNPQVSRAMQANTNYWYRWTCNGTPDSIRGPVQTSSPANGNTWLDPVPPSLDAAGKGWNYPGWRGYPWFTKWGIGDTTAPAETIIDPATGIPLKRATMPESITNLTADFQITSASGTGWTASDSGTLIHAVSVDDSIYATTNTGNWLTLYTTAWLPGIINGGSPQSYLEKLIASLKVWYTGSAHNVEIAITTDGVNVWPTSTNTYAVAAGNTSLPSVPITYGGGSQSMFPWTPAGVIPLQSGDISARGTVPSAGATSQVTVDVSGNVSWVLNTNSRRNRFYQGWGVGTPIVIGNSLCTLTAYVNPELVTINPAACIPALSVPTAAVNYTSTAFGIMIRRPAGVTDPLNVQYGKATMGFGNSGLVWTSGGEVLFCNNNLKLNSVTHHLGSLCAVSNKAFWVDSQTGDMNYILNVTAGTKSGTDGWSSSKCPTNQAFLGTAPTSMESLYCVGTDNIGKKVILSCNLLNAAGTGLPTYQAGNASLSCTNITKSSTNSDFNSLMAAFTSGQETQYDPVTFTNLGLNEADPWSDNKVWLSSGRGGQDTYGWMIMFDPTKVGTAPGCVGGGLPGCITSAGTSYASFPNRWDVFHSLAALGNVALFVGHGMGNSPGLPGGNLFAVSITNAQLPVTPSIAAGAVNGGTRCPASGIGCDLITVDGEPCVITPAAAFGSFPAEPKNCPKAPTTQSWLQNAKVGDILMTGDCITTTSTGSTVGGIRGCNDKGDFGEVEFLKVLDKRLTAGVWTSSLVQRGLGPGAPGKTTVTASTYTSVSATKAVRSTGFPFSPGMVGKTIILNSASFTVATYVDNLNITVSTDPGDHATSLAWVWPHQTGSTVVTYMGSTGRTQSGSSFFPGGSTGWDINNDPHYLNTTGTTVAVAAAAFYDHGAYNYTPNTGVLTRVGGVLSSDPNLPSGAGYSLYSGQSLPVNNYPPTGYVALGPKFNNQGGVAQTDAGAEEHPAIGAINSNVFGDSRMISGPGGQTLWPVTGNLWKMLPGLLDSSGDNYAFLGWGENAICSTVGTAVTRISGTPFSTSTPNTSGFSNNYWINGVGYHIVSVMDASHLVLSSPGAGTQTSVPCYGGTASGAGNVLRMKLNTYGVWNMGQSLVDVSSTTLGNTIGGTSTDQFKFCHVRKAGECQTGSALGEFYVNAPFLGPRTQFYSSTQPGCTQVGAEPGTIADLCIAQTAAYVNSAQQIGQQNDITGQYGRVISHQLVANKFIDANSNVHYDASGGIMLMEGINLTGSEFEVLSAALPPLPAPDAYDRTRYVPVLASLPLVGTSIPAGAASARVAFGYAEYGTPTSYFGTTRQEKTYANTTGLIPNVPFLYATTDGPVAGLACAGGCTVWVPGIPEHTVSMAAEWLDSGGIVLRTDVLPSVIVAPSAFTSAAGCSIIPAALASGTTGTTYAQTPTAINCGSGTLTWTTTGLLPNGLGGCNGTTGISCTIQGTPTVAGSTLITVQVTDGGSNTATMPYTIVIANPTCFIAPAAVPNGTTGIAYSQSLTASGCGTNTLTWSISAGALPNGLSISSSTGAITGTPTVANNFNFTVKVTDGAFNTDTNVYAVTILAPVSNCAISTTSLVGGTVGVPYSQAVTATNCGGGTLTWSTTGSLPSGITGCNGTHGTSCTYSGTPSVAGNFPITTGVTDGGSNSDTNPFTITVVQPTPPPTSGTSLIRSGTLVTSGTIAH